MVRDDVGRPCGVMTTLTVQDLWDDPVAVAELLQLWDDVRGAAGGGPGSGLP